MSEVELDDNTLNRLARKHLKLPLEGRLSQENANRVMVEASIIKARREILAKNPTAQIRRTGNKLSVTLVVGR